jgi:hypothetical protein
VIFVDVSPAYAQAGYVVLPAVEIASGDASADALVIDHAEGRLRALAPLQAGLTLPVRLGVKLVLREVLEMPVVVLRVELRLTRIVLLDGRTSGGG